MLLHGVYAEQPGTSLTAIARDGSIRRGKVGPTDDSLGFSGPISPDGIAYTTWASNPYPEGTHEISRITGTDLSGVRAGWPVKVDGIASEAAFGADGRVVFTIGSRDSTTSRIAVFDRDGNVVARSTTFPLKTAESGVDCVVYAPRAPITAADGTVFLWSELDRRIFALDAALNVRPGWPYRPANWLVHPGWDDPTAELGCSPPAAPSVGPTGTLYLPLEPRDESVGGTLVALDLDGRPHAGWPVTLQRPGAEFLWTVVGSDGTVYALAKEPEAGNSASVTILAIAPDSTVLYRTTIIEP
jgi:WD40 repeat protein